MKELSHSQDPAAQHMFGEDSRSLKAFVPVLQYRKLWSKIQYLPCQDYSVEINMPYLYMILADNSSVFVHILFHRRVIVGEDWEGVPYCPVSRGSYQAVGMVTWQDII